MKKVIKKEVKKEKIIKKVTNNPFTTIFNQFRDFINQKFKSSYMKLTNNDYRYIVNDNTKIRINLDTNNNICNIYIRIDNTAICFYLSNYSVSEYIYKYDKNTLIQKVFDCKFLNTNKIELKYVYDLLKANILNLEEYLK